MTALLLAAVGAAPPVWLIVPFVALLAMIATGPLFYAHFWHKQYPKVAVGLGALVVAYYLATGNGTPVVHAAQEYVSFIALLAALFVASGTILIRTDFAGTPRANVAMLFVGAVLANLMGTTGASMLLIRPFMRLNAGRLKPYHIVFFIFIVSNVGGALTPDRRPAAVPRLPPRRPVLLDRRAPLVHLAPDRPRRCWRSSTSSTAATRTRAAASAPSSSATRTSSRASTPTTSTPSTPRSTSPSTAGAASAGSRLTVALVFVDPNVIAGVPDLHALGSPLGIREILMLGVAFLAYKTANKTALDGNRFSFEPIQEVAWLFIGIFLTMQPALQLISIAAAANSGALNATTFYFGTGMLSGVLDNAPTYIAFVTAAMAKFIDPVTGLHLDIGNPQHVAFFAHRHLGGAESWYYLQAISIASVFWGAMTYIGNGPNFMVKAIAESAGAETPSFVTYVVKYSLPILLPIYLVVWLVWFSGWIIPHPM